MSLGNCNAACAVLLQPPLRFLRPEAFRLFLTQLIKAVQKPVCEGRAISDT